MPQMTHPNGDVRVVPAALVDKFVSKGWEVTDARVAEVVSTLKGKALTDALVEAGLSKSGTVAEKHARLTEHVQQHLTDTPEEKA